jgi:arylsulfatase A-like enzyme
MRHKLITLGVIVIFTGLVLFSLVVIIKPGASIFYYKFSLPAAGMAPDEGFAYRYPLNFNRIIFQPRGALLFEAGQQLPISPPTVVVETGQGAYAISLPEQGMGYLYFSALDNSDPRSNGRLYRLYMPVRPFSRRMGLIYLSLLGLLLARFLYVSLRTPENRRTAFSSAQGFNAALASAFMFRLPAFVTPFRDRLVSGKSIAQVWRHLLLWVLLAAYAYVTLEWLFFVTKPSFMDLLTWGERITLLLQAGFFLALPALLLVLSLWALDWLLAKAHSNGLPLVAGMLIPAGLLACAALLLVDNFTYTLFRFGTASTEGLLRLGYAVLFLALLFYIYRSLLGVLGLRGLVLRSPASSRSLALVLAAVFLVSLFAVGLQFDPRRFAASSTQAVSAPAQAFPNIILLGGDGLNAANLSLYGYERQTTPTMEKLAGASLVVENVFTNAGNSSGSVISIFTGKLPMQTRVLYPPDILQDEDSYEHLPGILKRLGYSTLELGVNHYVDAYQMNVRNGFDAVNGRSLGDDSLYQSLQGRGYDDTFYFGMQLAERIAERLRHIFFIAQMENPFATVTEPTEWLMDDARLASLLELINSSDQPFFAHVHMMGTHGARFNPAVQKYSVGKSQDEDWMLDFYDDAILTYDAQVAQVLDALESSGKLDDTLVILYTDHGFIYSTNVRIMLLMRFPIAEHAGRLQSNLQNLDIAPTILDYLGQPIPEWMAGESFLNQEPDPERLIFATGTREQISQGSLVTGLIKPPFYQFSYFNVVQCNRWWQVDVRTFEWTSGELDGHTAPCSPESLLTQTEIQQALADLLESYGYNVSSLR